MSSTPTTYRRLPAEWEAQEFIQLTWPHDLTDWAYMLDEAHDCFLRIAEQIAARQRLLIVARDAEALKAKIGKRLNMSNVSIRQVDSDDTWARDHGGISVYENGSRRVLDFKFNAWGEKFSFAKDDAITAALFDDAVNCRDFVLEGGSIESDGEGTILTTTQCLLNKNRNPHLSKDDIVDRLKREFGAQRVLWLDYGYLAGDDTDSHIDTLARLCPNNTIVYVHCDDPSDEHYEALNAMRLQLESFRTAAGEPYRLVALPMPDPAFEGELRLPATYANYLVINTAVLLPIYGSRNDALAIEQIKKAYPNHDIVPVNCSALIHQHGSLHCVTMQYPVKTDPKHQSI